MPKIVLELEGDIQGVEVAGASAPAIPPTQPGGSFMGGLKGILDLLNKIGPLLELFQDPAFLQLLDKLVKLFGNKQSLTADDLDALKAELDSQVQEMRANP